MTCVVVIPVGPTHRRLWERAAESVTVAFRLCPGPFRDCALAAVPDLDGRLGRSRARNIGMDEHPADFHFLLDADDRMMPDAFGLIDESAAATFGAVWLDGRRARSDRWPVTRETLFEHGAAGTLSMGCFVRGDLGLRFDASLDNGEDFDFYMRLPSFTKRHEPLVDVTYRAKRRRRAAGWQQACDSAIARYRP